MKVDVLNLDATNAGEIDLPDEIFGLEPRTDLLHRMVAWQMAKRRQGTHKVRNRGEISASKRKIQRQKGAGRARHGVRGVNLMRGGGRAFGPVPRSHAIGLPKKIRALALRHALSSKQQEGCLVVLENIDFPEIRTARAKDMIGALGVTSAFILDGLEPNRNFALSVRNLPGIDLVSAAGANVVDMLRHDTLLLTRRAVAALTERFA